ncbi:MAG: carbohydrate ABC transporter permease [Firmicutes bacterium]|nr:carbohydrate ABC transporter permease [Bacillota bacterium]
MIRKTLGEKVFDVFNYIFLTALALSCVLPFIHMLAISFSSSAAATQGRVGLWPVEFTLSSYRFAFQRPDFIRSFGITLERVILGWAVNMFLVIITAYPLSKTKQVFKGRTLIAWFFAFTMFVGGGLIPTYMVVTSTGLKNTIWALIIPGAVPIYHMVILLNFFRQIPKEIEESALMDGARQNRILWQIYVPLSIPALATLTVYTVVGHWNEWFSGMIYMDDSKNYPLQTYLQSIITTPDFSLFDTTQIELLKKISNKTFRAAQIMIVTMPVLLIYPFMQKYFISGMTLGSLKG